MRKLRVSHVVVQAVLVWDDGEELSPGPEVNPIAVPVSQLAGLAVSIPEGVEKIQEEGEGNGQV